ncbi:uncharacterized protein [Watersipora subatra]|uniref:uncharacterized protein n=1 Tax=Watersipora subatra TaxID=2589382 RepID=UPI00355B3AAD
MTPKFPENYRLKDFLKDASTIKVEIEDIFSPVNGSVHLFNLIVAELNSFFPEGYLDRTIEANLTTWLTAQDYPYWPPYLIHKKCQLFTGAGCPDIAYGQDPLHKQSRRSYSAKDPVFTGSNAFVSSLSDATGLEDVAITNDNLYLWTTPGERQSSKTLTAVFEVRSAPYVIGRQTCGFSNKSQYCNGLLRYASDYCIKFRAYTNEHYIDSPCAYAIEDASSLLVQWSKATLIPLLFAWLPIFFFTAIVIGVVVMTGPSEDLDEPEIEKIRKEKRKLKIQAKWKATIFKAYDTALTVDNEQAVKLLTVEEDDTFAEDNLPTLAESSAPQTKRKLEKSCSYFTKEKPWFHRMSIDAQMYDGSNTSLNQNIPTRETYNPNEILHEQHIPSGLFQEGQLIKNHYLLRKSWSDTKTTKHTHQTL